MILIFQSIYIIFILFNYLYLCCINFAMTNYYLTVSFDYKKKKYRNLRNDWETLNFILDYISYYRLQLLQNKNLHMNHIKLNSWQDYSKKSH